MKYPAKIEKIIFYQKLMNIWVKLKKNNRFNRLPHNMIRRHMTCKLSYHP